MNSLITKLKLKSHRLTQILGLQKKYYRNDKVLKKIIKQYSKNSSKALDIGSGPEPKNPFEASDLYGLDLRENPKRQVVYGDLSAGKLPFPDNTFDFVTAYDVLEHIQRVSSQDKDTIFPFISLINEIFRVLKVDGIFLSLTPCTPFKEAFQDPTHVIFMTEDTLEYYFCESAWARIYGFYGTFCMKEQGWFSSKYFAFMQKSQKNKLHNVNFKQQDINDK